MRACRVLPDLVEGHELPPAERMSWLAKAVLNEGIDLTDIQAVENGLSQLCSMSQCTPLMLAAMHGRRESCELLLKADGEAGERTNSRGLTGLMLAVLCGQLEVVRLLLDPKQLERTSLFGHGLLHLAVLSGQLAVLQLVVMAPKHTEHLQQMLAGTNLRGTSCAQMAMMLPSEPAQAMIKLLAEVGCPLSIRNNLGETALHWAIELSNSPAVAQLLLSGVA